MVVVKWSLCLPSRSSSPAEAYNVSVKIVVEKVEKEAEVGKFKKLVELAEQF